jgi:hypothetical protein
MLLYRGLHGLTKVSSKISAIKSEPYYPRHKDSVHYVITFRVNNFSDRLAVYIGDQKDLANNTLIPLLDTNRTYTILVDETEPSYDRMILGVRKIILNDKVIYKESRLLTLSGGILAIIFAIFFLYTSNKKSVNGS